MLCRYVKFDTFHPAVDLGLPVTRVISRVVLQKKLAEKAEEMEGAGVLANDCHVVDYEEVSPSLLHSRRLLNDVVFINRVAEPDELQASLIQASQGGADTSRNSVVLTSRTSSKRANPVLMHVCADACHVAVVDSRCARRRAGRW